MRKMNGTIQVNDDEWYTPMETAERVVDWLVSKCSLPLGTHILCPADILPDGSESVIPIALRKRGFNNVRVTRDLPTTVMFSDWNGAANIDLDGVEGELIVTNPPFSLLVPFREWLYKTGAPFCILSRIGTLKEGWTIPEMGHRFHSTDGRSVVAAWFQNLLDTSETPPEEKAIGNCALCERTVCPNSFHTRDWTPGKPRPLFGVGIATKYGIATCHCKQYVVDGKKSFNRYFKKEETSET